MALVQSREIGIEQVGGTNKISTTIHPVTSADHIVDQCWACSECLRMWQSCCRPDLTLQTINYHHKHTAHGCSTASTDNCSIQFLLVKSSTFQLFFSQIYVFPISQHMWVSCSYLVLFMNVLCSVKLNSLYQCCADVNPLTQRLDKWEDIWDIRHLCHLIMVSHGLTF